MGTIVVTGSASGIGAATKWRLEAAGHRVVGIDVRGADVVADLASPEGRVAAVGDVRVVYDVGDSRRGIPADAVVIADAVRAGAPLADMLQARGVEVHVIGDAGEVGYIEGAIHSAWRVARAI
jgi:nucleoside-diphosphate-sugar epimerase